jgi:alanine racemase
MAMECRSWVEVSRRQIADNYRAVAAAVGPGVEIAAVVKADGYGHGAVGVSRVLEREGARWFAVSTAEEGAILRQAGIGARVLVMADSLGYTRPALAEYSLTPVVHSFEDLAALDEFAAGRGLRLPYHLKIDTGMGRLGTRARAAEIAAAVGRAGHTELEGLMSHFASAADYTTSQTDAQMRAFDELSTALCGLGIAPALRHIASSNAVAYGRREAWHNMARTGHVLYGYVSPARGPAPAPILDVRPALSWKASVLSVKEVPAGARIGYGGMFRAPRPMRIAILGVGYADGLSHRLSNRGHVIAGGKPAAILGAVSMDLTTIDASECPSLAPGGWVTLLGSEGEESINAQQMARMAGTISYDVLCGIRARVRRVYV